MEAFLSQIQIFPYTYAPQNWLLCNGSLLSINQFSALFSLIGRQYGGDGVQNFALPNLQGSVSYGANLIGSPPIGTVTGATTVVLDQSTLPSHTHGIVAQTAQGNLPKSAGNTFALMALVTKSGGTGTRRYSTAPANTPLPPQTIGPTGGSQAHNNVQPYLAMGYYMCVLGNFPPRS
ncbi:MAG: phage tail protein [Janthinobacterium lividum]